MVKNIIITLLCALSISQVYARNESKLMERKLVAATIGFDQMSLALPDWKNGEIDKEPVVFYDISNDTLLYIYSVYNKEQYLGYIAVNRIESFPLYEEVSNRIHPLEQFEQYRDKILSLLHSTRQTSEPKFIYVASDYYVTLNEANPKFYVNLYDFSVHNMDSLKSVHNRYIARLARNSSYNSPKWGNLLDYSNEADRIQSGSSKILSGVPNYTWYRGCYPTSMAMVFNYLATRSFFSNLHHNASSFNWDGPLNYLNPRYNARYLADHFADYYRFPESGWSGHIEKYGIDGSEQANSVESIANNHGYNFSSSYINSDEAWRIKREIDNDRPFKVGGSGHASCAYGYTDYGENVYRWDTYGNSCLNPRTNQYIENHCCPK